MKWGAIPDTARYYWFRVSAMFIKKYVTTIHATSEKEAWEWLRSGDFTEERDYTLDTSINLGSGVFSSRGRLAPPELHTVEGDSYTFDLDTAVFETRGMVVVMAKGEEEAREKLGKAGPFIRKRWDWYTRWEFDDDEINYREDWLEFDYHIKPVELYHIEYKLEKGYPEDMVIK